MFFAPRRTRSPTEFFLCPPDGKFILRETLRYSVVSFIYDAKIIPRQSGMSANVFKCPQMSSNVFEGVKKSIYFLVEWWKFRIFMLLIIQLKFPTIC